MHNRLSDKVTVLVNSCDAYADLWYPFFTLLKKYWQPKDLPILLNTETLEYSLDGLNIRCVHPTDPKVPYGERMLQALSKVETDYVIPLLDDFFLREPVDQNQIATIIQWMENDTDIVYFNCDCTPVYEDWEKDIYPGYKRIPWGNDYTLNMQAAIWRTEKLKSYWRPNVSPWEWEVYCNLRGALNKHEKFYCATTPDSGFCRYGFNPDGMGVFRGKWVMSDVAPLFEKEGISVDFSKRGEYIPEESVAPTEGGYSPVALVKRKGTSSVIRRCLPQLRLRYWWFVKRNAVLGSLASPSELVFVRHLSAKAIKAFYERDKWQRRKALLKTQGLSGLMKKLKSKVAG